jgi:peptide/nickel transport system substrate-binding protein
MEGEDMKTRDVGDGSGGRGLTRRELVKSGALFGLGAGLVGSGFIGAGCGGGSTAAVSSPSAAAVKPGGVMTIATDQLFPKDSLDPATNSTDGIDVLQGLIREGLVIVTPTFGVEPRLAESWDTSEDLTEYTFHLRPGVKWHDGTPLTAKDAEFTLQRILDSKVGNSLYDRVAQSLDPDGIQVIDDLTLKLKLKQPDSLFLLPLAGQTAYLTKADDTDFDSGLGTGPFTLKSWDPGRSYEVTKNAAYWADGEPYLDGVRGLQVAEASTKLQGVVTGSSDVTQVAFDQLAVVKANAKLQINPFEKAIAYNCVCDCTSKPFDDERVREALKRSLDREKVISIGFAGEGFAAPDAWVAMGDPYMTPELIERTKMDREEAQRLMTEAGYPDGLDLTLKVPGDALHANFGLGVAEGLKGSPFRVTTKQVPADTYWDTVWLKDPFCVDDWNRRQPLYTMSYNVKTGVPWNESHWSSPEMDEILKTSLTVTGDELDKQTSEACMIMSKGSGEIVPAYLNRLWVSRQGTVVKPVPTSLLDFRTMGFTE